MNSFLDTTACVWGLKRCRLGLIRACACAQVDTLPKGRDAKQGSVGTKGSAVGEADAPNLSSPSHIPLMNKDER